ncbi:type 11 methyltransferase [Enterobacter cancerogenus]|uniref:Type 11 methyltransferase n=1 Tax=Enterobacter cancerogenus TaxID=69218 RepID=A0A484Z9X5_9ENTR|nr:type 11 methyltransferase [Enterobacter cancerogenus]
MLCLEWVADPQAVLKTLWSMLRPGGALSLMFYNANGLLMRNVLVGNFGYVQQGMYKKKRRTLSPDFPREPQQVYGWLEEIGWEITGKTGVRVFHDYLRDKQKQHDCLDALTEIETPVLPPGALFKPWPLYPRHRAQAADARIIYE